MKKKITSQFIDGEILVVEDNPSDVKILSKILKDNGYKVRLANNGESALSSVKKKRPNIVLLGLQIRGIKAVEVCRQMKEDPNTADIPVIVISDEKETILKARALEAGAVDFVSRPFDEMEILIRIRNYLNHYRLLENLNESKEKYRLILDNTADTIAVHDLNLQTIYVSPSIQKLLGYTAEEVITQSLDQFVTPESFIKIKEILAHQLSLEESGEKDSLKTVSFEIEEYCKGGSVKWVELSASFIRDANLKPTEILTITRDISKRKQMEIYIQQQLKYTRALNEIATVIISEQDSAILIEKMANVTGKTIDIDRCLIYEVNFPKNILKAHSEWQNPKYSDIKPTKGIYSIDIFKSGINEMKKNRHYVYSHFDEIHPSLLLDNSDKILHGDMKIKSALWYPFAFHSEGYWILVLNEIHQKRNWTTNEIDFLNSVIKQVNIALEKIRLLNAKLIAEKEIQNQNQFLRKVLESLTHPFHLINAIDHKIILANSASGYQPGHKNKTCHQLTHHNEFPCQDKEHPCPLEIIKRTHKPVSVEHIHFDKNNNPRNIEVHGYPVLDEEGNVIQMIEYCLDITERKKAERELEISEKFNKSITESAGDAIISLNDEGLVLSWNRAATKMFGYKQEEMINNNIFPIIPDKYKILHQEAINKLKNGRKEKLIGSTIEIMAIKKDGTVFPIELSLSSWETSGQKSFVSIVRDMTKRKKYEENLKATLENAQESDRLKSAFLSNMSHEIRTPMNGILGFTELLDSSDLSKIEGQEYIDAIKKSGDRLLSTINEIIDISKIEAGQMKVSKTETSINNLFNELINFFNPQASSKGLSLISLPTLTDRESIILTDNDKLYGILTNLINNAIKFTKKGSVTFGYFLKDNFIEFYVKDTGVGVPMNKQQTIFNRFEQADYGYTREFEGSGVGLTISKAYVEMLGGKLWLISEEGKESEFRFTIPYETKSA